MTGKFHLKLLLLPVLFLCLLALPYTAGASEKVYQITETQLLQLEKNSQLRNESYQKQENLLNNSNLTLTQSQQALTEAQRQLQKVKLALESQKILIRHLEQRLVNAENLVEKTNRSFNQYEAEMKRKVQIAKNQRNAWFGGLVVTGIYALAK